MSRWYPSFRACTLVGMSHAHGHTALRSRRRNLLELWMRAYWKTYCVALAWVVGVQVIIAILLER